MKNGKWKIYEHFFYRKSDLNSGLRPRSQSLLHMQKGSIIFHFPFSIFH
ncbi:hypothetical protein ELI_1229 [Eubacterium callanderi]|uniref:Uncharacterized protein n=1 Tax=Eubacterium callanderi TaxID=53442 RepID=E3GKX3_9FIRM|nr:hypothetical protein ELI_1229 [Eubacterium callanderi]